MSNQPERAFAQSALASRLLSREQIDKARAALRAEGDAADDPGAEQLADKLIEMGLLNGWQASQLLEGRTKFNLGPYWIIDSIGRGGMGQVFKGEHEVLARVVAIKVLPREKSTPEAIRNFTAEIRAQASLDHDNLVRAFDAGTDGNVYYLVTEYVPGTDLRKLIRSRGPMGMAAAAGIISQVAEGLHHAHENGLIHRDVKPGNVLVTPDGHAKLSDLGLVGSSTADAESDPRFGKIVGTADYLSPDHIQAPWNPTPAWDIYSLGCTLYYAVTGKVPFPHGSTADKARAHCTLQPLDPRRLNPELDASFVEVMADMLAKEAADRVSSAAEVVHRLRPWMEQTSEIALVDHRRPRSARPRARSNVVPPPVQTRATEGLRFSGAGEGQLEDTKSSFPEISASGGNQKEGSGEISQTTDPVASASEDTFSGLEIVPEPEEPLGVLSPLLVLVLLPLGLVGAVLLVWWLSQVAVSG